MNLIPIPHIYQGPRGIVGNFPRMIAVDVPYREVVYNCNAYEMEIRCLYFCSNCSEYKRTSINFKRPIPGEQFSMKRIIFGCNICSIPLVGFSGFNNSNWELWGCV